MFENPKKKNYEEFENKFQESKKILQVHFFIVKFVFS